MVTRGRALGGVVGPRVHDAMTAAIRPFLDRHLRGGTADVAAALRCRARPARRRTGRPVRPDPAARGVIPIVPEGNHQKGTTMIPTDVQTVPSTSVTTPPVATPPARSIGSIVAVVAGFALQGVTAVFVAASGLMMSMWAVLAMWLVWLGGLAIQVRHRRRPLVVVAVPIVVAAIWLLTGTLGEAFLGWTA